MNRIVCIDVETGGVDENQHKLLQVGIVALDDNLEIIGQDEFYVSQPMYRIEQEAMNINKLDLKEVISKGILPFMANMRVKNFVEECFGTIESKDDRPVMLGHNVQFDQRFVKKQLFDDVGDKFESTFSHRTICTHSILQFLSNTGMLPQGSWKSHLAFEHFGIKNENAHTALSDALATVELYKGCVKLAMGEERKLA